MLTDRVNFKKRDSNLELFRIVSMLLIIAHHYVVNSGLRSLGGPVYLNPLSLHSLFLLIWGAWGKIGINCFVLISGYFMCKSNITAKKFAKLFLEWMFYRVIVNGVFWITGYAAFSVKGLLQILIPITKIGDGFVSAYIVFFLFIPFLNILIKNINEKQHIRLLLLCSFTYIFLGTVPFFTVTMNYVSWFIVLYFIASYLRLYTKKLVLNTKFWCGMTIISVLMCITSVIACVWLGAKLNRFMPYIFVTDSNTFLAVLTGVSAFMLFKNIKIPYNRFINTVAASTFGVLLIHANSDTMRQWLWKDVLNNVEMYNSTFGYVHAIISVILIFVVCTVIDYLRIHLIETPFFKLWDKKWDKILLKFNKADEKIWKKLGVDVK
ncbi:MAG: acyltransferase [Lachnospiraceae bacterium]|nr:acyltransferase [Lachnospiraceae bacterium]